MVVPTRQRAAATRLAFNLQQLACGRKSWPSCDVLPWVSWLVRCAASVRHNALAGRRVLSPNEEWLAWRAAARFATDGLGLLNPTSLADALRCSAARVRDGALSWPQVLDGESGVLRRAREFMTRLCAQRQAVLGDDWTQLLEGYRAGPQPLLIYGFDELGSALTARLGTLGGIVQPAPDIGPDVSAVATEVVAGVDHVDELRRAALWCREQLLRNAGARVLVIHPALHECRAEAQQAFDHALLGAALLGAGGPSAGGPSAAGPSAAGSSAAPMQARPYVVEGGIPLADYPLVRAALALLALESVGLEFTGLAALLRSSFLGWGTPGARAALELELRDRNVHFATCEQLGVLLRTARGAWAEGLGAGLGALTRADDGARSQRQSAENWARHYAQVLERWGWPGGQSLDSLEQQQRERFETLLGELAALDSVAGMLSAGSALDLLQGLAARTAFEAASDDAAVTLTASTGDPVVRYDAIWVAGVNAESWPEPAQPDPFIPIAAQRSAGVLVASAGGQVARAQRSLAAWRRCTDRLVLSWSQTQEEVPSQPSHLLAAFTSAATDGNVASTTRLRCPDPLVLALAARAAPDARESRPSERGLAWPAGQPLPRGTETLSLQAGCPFRAAAEVWLAAKPLNEPRPGIDPRERGRLLHFALEVIWAELKESATLHAVSAAKLNELVARATDQALRAMLSQRAMPLPQPLLENERARTCSLISALLEQETERSAFVVQSLEQAETRQLAGVPIRVRFDRLDRLADGRVAVIDYKSGVAHTFKTLDAQPRHIQLLVYAQLAGEPLAGVAGVHLRANGIHWRGAAADAEVFPALKVPRAPEVPWAEQQAHWSREIEQLVRGFVEGSAAVQPAPQACEYCHLAALCRIDERESRTSEAADEDTGIHVEGI